MQQTLFISLSAPGHCIGTCVGHVCRIFVVCFLEKVDIFLFSLHVVVQLKPHIHCWIIRQSIVAMRPTVCGRVSECCFLTLQSQQSIVLCFVDVKRNMDNSVAAYHHWQRSCLLEVPILPHGTQSCVSIGVALLWLYDPRICPSQNLAPMGRPVCCRLSACRRDLVSTQAAGLSQLATFVSAIACIWYRY